MIHDTVMHYLIPDYSGWNSYCFGNESHEGFWKNSMNVTQVKKNENNSISIFHQKKIMWEQNQQIHAQGSGIESVTQSNETVTVNLKGCQNVTFSNNCSIFSFIKQCHFQSWCSHTIQHVSFYWELVQKQEFKQHKVTIMKTSKQTLLHDHYHWARHEIQLLLDWMRHMLHQVHLIVLQLWNVMTTHQQKIWRDQMKPSQIIKIRMILSLSTTKTVKVHLLQKVQQTKRKRHEEHSHMIKQVAMAITFHIIVLTLNL